jgi:hypothetical protein
LICAACAGSGAAGCFHWVLDGSKCMDDNPCTLGEHCTQDAKCVGEAIPELASTLRA